MSLWTLNSCHSGIRSVWDYSALIHAMQKWQYVKQRKHSFPWHFFPALAVYDNMKCQNINRDKIAAIHTAQHLWTPMLMYKIKVSFLEYLIPRYSILGEQVIEQSNWMSRKISQEWRLKYKEEGKTDPKPTVTFHIDIDWLNIHKKTFQTRWDQQDCNVCWLQLLL